MCVPVISMLRRIIRGFCGYSGLSSAIFGINLSCFGQEIAVVPLGRFMSNRFGTGSTLLAILDTRW